MKRTIRVVVAATGLILGAPGAQAWEPKAAPEPIPDGTPPVAVLGSKAPPLAIANWVKGEKAEKFEPGKAYIVEFWATWCGPCIQNIPHLTKLQKKYKDRGLVVIGISSADQGGIAVVKPFVEKQGERMGYTVALDDSGKTALAYMAATGQQGIPVAYVIDRTGKLAWYGHPSNGLDDVVRSVLAEGFESAAYAKQRAALQERYEKIHGAIGSGDFDTAEKEMIGVARDFPDQTADSEMGRFVLMYAYKNDKPGAIEKGKTLLAGALKDETERLAQMTEMLVNDPAAPEGAKDFALAMAERVVAAEDDKVIGYTTLADVRHMRGEDDLAIAAQEKAVAACPDEGSRKGHEAKLDQLKSGQKGAGAGQAAGQVAAPAGGQAPAELTPPKPKP